ncbi:hypothetical protein PR048_019383 [Dryococelus australis]|uniref:Uncharacterized protein n=1 Tax=Dryococelus australis TaxID=614101 RepID=A0ABQ9H3E7_9NEOP|nr:hypothetical protein PR048_019383 [Dryococelus australis]
MYELRPAGERLSENFGMRLVSPYANYGRNTTTYSVFISLQSAENLREKKTIIVDTMNRTRREIPSGIKSSTVEHHCSKTWRITVNQGVDIGGTRKRIPGSVHFYNCTKYGVDIIDQVAKSTLCVLDPEDGLFKYSTSWIWQL